MEPLNISEVDPASLKDKHAFITGGASGIGKAVAESWAKEGAFVTIADILPESAGSTVAAKLGANVQYVLCDVTDWQSQVAAFKTAIRGSPSQALDIVATFAGTAFAAGNQVDHVLAAGEPSLDAELATPDTRNLDVNLLGAYYSSWLALYYLRLKPANGVPAQQPASKSLIFVSSIAGYMDSPKACTYPASKFGVRGLFRSTRARTLDIGVRCNLLAPWFVDTPLMAPVKNAMACRGMDMARVLGFASIESCVQTATYAAATNIHGRALVIQPEGTFDLKDNVEDGWAGDQLRPIMQRRREAGFSV
ncbi:aflH adhA short chain alcohol dehydrogenase [Lecanosticta acicola]|uniref:AflH adhA short chain alcohol dehydrogenase n=1 Tax=Lecanosticta acicola TaxID=111012 RepID=A0AAI8Z8S1_9PEZI|nr:aflH adhA short chain alcohol dehydrogenase [Lecanosticta acicola]